MSAERTDAHRPSQPARAEHVGAEKPAIAEAPAVAEARGRSAEPYTVVVARNGVELRRHLDAWDDLAASVAEPNPFYEPWVILPALRAFGAGLDLRFCFVYEAAGQSGRPARLCGFLPLVRRTWCGMVPVLESWRHAYCFLTTPLLRYGHAEAVLERLFDVMAGREGAPLWGMEVAARDGVFGQAFVQVCFRRGRPAFVRDAYARALLNRGESADAYLQAAMGARSRKSLRGKRRKLADKGRLEWRELEPGGDVRLWAEQFLRLEASGWKGKAGSAMLVKAIDADCFRETAEAAFTRGKLVMLGLFLDGVPVAMKYTLVSGGGGFTCKIAMDEAHGACSPGLLLEVYNVEHLHRQQSVRWLDSCAAPGHPMLDALWADRRVVHTQLVGTGRFPGDFVVALLPLMRWFKACWRKAWRPRSAAPDRVSGG